VGIASGSAFGDVCIVSRVLLEVQQFASGVESESVESHSLCVCTKPALGSGKDRGISPYKVSDFPSQSQPDGLWIGP